MDYREKVFGELERVRRLYLTARSGMAIWRIVFAAAVILILLIVLTELAGPTVALSRFWLAISLVGIAWIAVIRIRRVRREAPDNARLALFIEERIGGFDESLVAAASIQPEKLTAEEKPLADELWRRVAEKLEKGDIGKAVDFGPARRARNIALIVIAAAAVLGVLLRDSALRAIFPFELPRAVSVQIAPGAPAAPESASAPAILSERHVIELPSYLHLPPQEGKGGDISALTGSKVKVIFKLSDSRVAFAANASWSPAPKTIQRGDEAELSFELNDSGKYDVFLTAPGEKPGSPLKSFKVEAVKDAPPQVTITAPGGDIEMPIDQKVDVTFDATDDYGIADLAFYYNINGGSNTYVSSPKPADGVPTTHRTGSFSISAESIKVKAGDVVTYFARAEDGNTVTGPGRAWSKRYFIFCMEPAQPGAGAGSSKPSNRPPANLTAAERRIILATAAIVEGMETSESGDWDHRSIARSQEALGTVVTKMADQFYKDEKWHEYDLCRDTLDLFRQIRTLLLTRYPDDALELEQQTLPMLYELEGKLSMAGGGGGGGGQSAMQETIFSQMKTVRANQTAVPSAMQSSKPPAAATTPKPSEFPPDVVEAVRHMEELARREERLAQSGGGGGSNQQQLDQSAQEAQQLADQLKNAAAKNEGNSPLAQAAAKLAQAAAEMRAASQAAAKGQQGMAAAKSRAASQAVQEALAAMSKNASNSMRQRVSQHAAEARLLARRAENLADAEKRSAGGFFGPTEQALRQYEKEQLNSDVGAFRQSLENLEKEAKELSAIGAAPAQYAEKAGEALAKLPESLTQPDADHSAQAGGLNQAADSLEAAAAAEPSAQERMAQAAAKAGEIAQMLESGDHKFGEQGSGNAHQASPQEIGASLKAIIPINVQAGTRDLALALAAKLEAAAKMPEQEQVRVLHDEALPMAKDLHERLLEAARAAESGKPSASIADEYPPEYRAAVEDYYKSLAREKKMPVAPAGGQE